MAGEEEAPKVYTLSVVYDGVTGEMKFEVPQNAVIAAGLAMFLDIVVKSRAVAPAITPGIVIPGIVLPKPMGHG